MIQFLYTGSSFALPVLIIAQAVGLIFVCLMLQYLAPLNSILHAGIKPNQTRLFVNLCYLVACYLQRYRMIYDTADLFAFRTDMITFLVNVNALLCFFFHSEGVITCYFYLIPMMSLQSLSSSLRLFLTIITDFIYIFWITKP